MKSINQQIRRQIAFEHEKGLSIREISTVLHVSKSTVQKYLAMDGLRSRKSAGRPKKLSRRAESSLEFAILSGRAENTVELAKQMPELAVSPRTIGRALRKRQFRAKPKIKKPLLLKRHRVARLEFARVHENWTEDDWRQVIFSDESKINRFWSDGRVWIWKKKNVVISDREVSGTVKFGGGGLMVWGCITAKGVGYLTKIDGGLDKELYQDILRGEFLNTCSFYGFNPREIILQQDNDPKHTAKSTLKWIEDNKIRLLPWPSQSPDLNPIEHMWVNLKKKLAEYKNPPTGMLELWERVQDEWNKITPEECLKLIDSMPEEWLRSSKRVEDTLDTNKY